MTSDRAEPPHLDIPSTWENTGHMNAPWLKVRIALLKRRVTKWQQTRVRVPKSPVSGAVTGSPGEVFESSALARPGEEPRTVIAARLVC
jgi:hypothetical protein